LDYSILDCKLTDQTIFSPEMEKSIYTEYTLLLEVLRSARESAGLTQAEIASKLDETQTFVSKCERGERRLDIIELRNWCAALGITMHELIHSLESAISGSTDD
jgi:transcriptional regulator with XRE-family HTH domain